MAMNVTSTFSLDSVWALTHLQVILKGYIEQDYYENDGLATRYGSKAALWL